MIQRKMPAQFALVGAHLGQAQLVRNTPFSVKHSRHGMRDHGFAGAVLRVKGTIHVAINLGPPQPGALGSDNVLRDTRRLHVTRRCTTNGVEAHMLNNQYLLIPGSNGPDDDLRFALRIRGLGTRRLTFREEARKLDVDKRTRAGFSRTIRHQGFLRHANRIYHRVGKGPDNWPRAVIGHSLGAAAAQILSKTWAAPAIGFAAPRPRKTYGKIAFDEPSLSVCRDDDIVCCLPSSFRRTGQTRILRRKSPKGSLNHNTDADIDALNNRKPNLKIPRTWSP